MAKRNDNMLPRDRFDEPQLHGRVGAHRIVGKPNRFWVYAVSALVGIVVLTGAGIAAVMFADINVTKLFEESNSQVEPEEVKVQPQLDPTAEIVVLNGTPLPDFALVVDEEITLNSWGVVIFAGDAATTDITTTTVYYLVEADEPAALGLAEQLGGAAVELNPAYAEYNSRLAVVLGIDYRGPGQEQLDAVRG